MNNLTKWTGRISWSNPYRGSPMPYGRPLAPLSLSPAEREQLVALTRSRSMPHALVTRAQIVLLAADGVSNTIIAERLRLSKPTVGQWRQRYLRQRVQGLYDELRPGGPRAIRDEQIARLLRRTLKTTPHGGTHWSCRTLAAETRLSKSTIHRVWTAFGLQPHRQKHFQLSTDPFFVEKVRDLVGLYLHPPDKAMVLCVDEKSQIQALDRTQPLLPLGLGYVEGVTHGYLRHGTTTLFAALDIASGRVLTECRHRHRHQEFLQFLRHIGAAALPRALHADLRLLAQSGRDLVRPHHPARHPPRHLPQRRRPGRQDRGLRAPLQSPLPSVHVDRDGLDLGD